MPSIAQRYQGHGPAQCYTHLHLGVLLRRAQMTADSVTFETLGEY